MRIAFCHFDSLAVVPALNVLFADLGDEIGLVLSSQRFGSRHGGFWHQTLNGWRRDGVRLSLWMGFELIAVGVAGRCADLIARLTGRPPVLETLPRLAARHGARFLRTRDVNDAETRAAIAAYAPDVILVMNFDQILRPPVIALARLAAVNVHPALLPDLRGPCPVLWAVGERRPATGVTIHLIEDQTIDTGPILAQVILPLAGDPSVSEVNGALFVAGARALRPVLARLAAGDRGTPQPAAAGQYRRLPTAAERAGLRRNGLRLWRLGEALRLLLAVLGVAGWKGGAISPPDGAI